jgi:hypothetical protein
VHRQVESGNDFWKQRLGRLRDGVGRVQSDMRRVMPMRLWTLRPSKAGCRETISLGN